MNDTVEKIEEIDVIDERRITKEDMEYLARHFADVPKVDVLLKRMMSDAMNGYFVAVNDERRYMHKAEFNFIKKIRAFVLREKEIQRRKGKTL